jgi:signal peptidase
LLKLIRLLLALPLALLAVAWFLTLRPEALGGPATYVMVHGQSMQPTLHSGELAVVRKQGSYRNGDVVAFRVPKGEPGEGAIVMHRIVGGSPEEGFVMQGDNKNAPDSWQPTGDDVVGRLWFAIPGGEQFVLTLRQPLILGLLAGGMGMLTVLGGGQKRKPPRHEEPPGQPSPAAPPDGRRRLRPPPGLTLWLLLALLATAAAIGPFAAGH